MKNSLTLLFALWATSVFSVIPVPQNYDPQFVNISSVPYQNGRFNVVYMHRSLSGNRIKVKYFAAKDEYGTTVSKRFENWAIGKNIICLSSGGYMDNSQTPVGINVDNGKIVNRTLEKFDGLVIVYATGGVVASNLKNANLTLQGPDISPGKTFDIRNSALDRTIFLNWCESEYATVFQTHLLVYKNALTIDPYNSSKTERERRFLAVGKEGAEVIHAIVHSPSATSLYEGARRTQNFLNSYKNMDVTFMINLDPGDQDVFFLYNEQGKIDNTIHGTRNLTDAANLLVYYYE